MKTDNIYLPFPTEVRSAARLSKDVKLLALAVPADFAYRPGQFVMASVWGAGEAPISITSTPGAGDLQLCVRSVGPVTSAINALEAGNTLWLRGPYGRPFPVDQATKDKLFVCGGIGIVPLRPLINLVLSDPALNGNVNILYGSRNPGEVLLEGELESWARRGANVVMTVDTCDLRDWKGCTGLVTDHFGRARVDFKDCTAYLCGPHGMIQAAMRDLSLMGVPDDRIITTLEAHMKCGVGKCGHCYCGGKLICEEGPVFSFAEIKKYRLRPGVDSLG